MQSKNENDSNPKNQNTEKSNVGNHFLNFNEAKDFLGISASTLYKLTSSKSIPFYKPKGKIYFIKDELVEYVKNKKEIVELNKNQN